MSVSADDWSRLDALLDEALDLPPDEQSAFLDAACGDDQGLRRQAERLLAAARDTGAFLERPVERLAGTLVADLKADLEGGSPAPGDRMGPYRILREVGRGGMGTVFEALRDDDQFEQRVALKVVAHRDDELRLRFLAERRILARLEHPHIARLFDGGVTDDGRPYFVMEFVAGEPMDRYADRKRLSVEDRLRLFATVCEAVAYAHANLIVHRDLKPSNLLVAETATGEPVVKLLDFGIAKILDAGEDQPALTRTGPGLMTPEYAAPEQVRGEPTSTSTDVYALGVLLYLLLTGHRPYRTTGHAGHEIAQAILEQEPERPSVAVTRRPSTATQVVLPGVEAVRLRRRLRGDLDNIILTALRKEPERRYATALQFAEDIRRHLAGLPVRARPDTVSYRASKFVRRNRAGVAAAALLAVLSVGFVTQVVRERNRAWEAQAKAEQVSAFLVGMFSAADPYTSNADTLRLGDFLRIGAQRLSELQDQPTVQAQLQQAIGDVYLHLGRYDEADSTLRLALATRRSALGEAHPDVAETLLSLGNVEMKRVRFDEADSLLGLALDHFTRHFGPRHRKVAGALNVLADLRLRQNRFDEADSLFRRSLALHEALLGPDHVEVARTLSGLGVVARRREDLEAAEHLHSRALALYRQRLGERHPDVAESLKNLALVYHTRNRFDEAEVAYRQALAVQGGLLGEDHPSLGTTLNSLASLLRMRGDYAEAEPLYRQAVEIQFRAYGGGSSEYANTLTNLGNLLNESGRPEEARILQERSLRLRRGLLGNRHPSTATSMVNLGLTYAALGQHARAEQMLREAAAIYTAQFGPDHSYVGIARMHLARVALDQGHLDRADTLLARAATALTEGPGLTLSTMRHLHGRLLLARGQLREAEPLLREALTMREEILRPYQWQAVESRNALAECLAALGQFDAADSLLLRTRAVVEARGSDALHLLPATRDALQAVRAARRGR